jgi:prepilin-type N-terminal cleavage/methylation domain-containing protein/prepilin-type processing-associated H-X9-DG protein
LIGHDLHTPNAKTLVKQSRCCDSFSLSLFAQEQYHALLTKISMTKSSPPPAERGFTLTEVLVVITIIAILAALLIPSLKSVLESAKATKDLSNLRQIGALVQSYLNDKDQVLPATATWPGTSGTPVLYPKYVGSRRIFQSPFDKRPALENDSAPVSYSINTNMYAASPGIAGNMLKVVSPSMTFFMAPTYTGSPGSASSWSGTATSAPDLPVGAPAETTGTHRNGQKINVLFCDWHTETVPFGPGSTEGTFQDYLLPLGIKHWDPTQ